MSETPSRANRTVRVKKYRFTSNTCLSINRLKALDPELSENQAVGQALRRLDLAIKGRLTGELLEQYNAGTLTREAFHQALAEARKAAVPEHAAAS